MVTTNLAQVMYDMETLERRRLKFWNIPVTDHLDVALNNAVKVDAHVSKADFVRDAVREKLKNMGLL